MKLKFDKHTENKICDFYKSGYTLAELSGMFKCSTRGISGVLKSRGITADQRTNLFRDFRDMYTEVANNYICGMSVPAIAVLYETTDHIVRRILVHLGVPLRKYTPPDKCSTTPKCAKCGADNPTEYTQKYSAICKKCYDSYRLHLQSKYG